jgi:hypothetical protein
MLTLKMKRWNNITHASVAGFATLELYKTDYKSKAVRKGNDSHYIM